MRGLSPLILLIFLFITGCGGGALIPGAPEVRSIDGTENNLLNSTWGAAGTQLLRLLPPQYADSVAELGGTDRPNPREISNAVFDQGASIPNSRGLSNMVWQWGQFVDHDIDMTPSSMNGDPEEPAHIEVPLGDIFFDPFNLGVVIPFFRSTFDPATGTDAGNPRQQINAITSYIDGSNVYGSDAARSEWLRRLQNGEMEMSGGEMLPFNDGTMSNDPDASEDLFVAGDVRANEQVGLTAMHILFLREHNRLCKKFKERFPDETDEENYQRARRWVGALIQAITYNEFLPAMLGPDAPGPYPGYDEGIDASIFNEFSTVFYRLGHTMITSNLERLDENGAEIPEGHLSLAQAFFDPTRITEEGGIDPILRGLVSQQMEEVDAKLVDELRNFLFGPPGAGGLDLASLNIQRGRDHGIPDYNTVREALGLEAKASFAEISSDTSLVAALEGIYGDINLLDPWVGGLAEDHLPGSSVGEMFTVGMLLQFENLRSGDRFFYQNDPNFTADELQEIEGTTLADVIRRNTGIENIQDNVFFVP